MWMNKSRADAKKGNDEKDITEKMAIKRNCRM
jgi:hypothetical protein